MYMYKYVVLFVILFEFIMALIFDLGTWDFTGPKYIYGGLIHESWV